MREWGFEMVVLLIEEVTEIHPSAVGREFKYPWCPQGHFKPEVGIAPNRRCLACQRKSSKLSKLSKRSQRKKRGSSPVPRVVFCPKGHRKSVVGVTKTGYCRQCKIEGLRAYRRRKAKGKFFSRLDAKVIPNLKRIRESVGLSQGDLASQAGVDRRNIQRIENEQQRAMPETQAKILSVIAPLLSQRKYEEMGL